MNSTNVFMSFMGDFCRPKAIKCANFICENITFVTEEKYFITKE